MPSQRFKESTKALAILRRILAANPPVVGLKPRDRKFALELVVSLLEARVQDAMED